MPNLLASLISTANALTAFDRALVVSQNNVINASTPGYAAQRLSLRAMDFAPEIGGIGGVRAGEIQSSRSLYAEQAVRRQMEGLGYFNQKAASLSALEPVFDVTGNHGVPGAMNRLFQSFSAWAAAPNSATARQSVIERARDLAEAFRHTAAGIGQSADNTALQLRQTVDRINQLGERLLQCNLERRRGALSDAGLDAKIQTTLEELSELTHYTAVFQPDGSVTVLVGGQTPLVVGEHQYRLGIAFNGPADPPPLYPGAPPVARLLNSEGRDVTAQISGGRLGGLLDIFNSLLPDLRGSARQAGDLNVLAKSVADRINQLLTEGLISDGPPPRHGVPLFTYDANVALAAQSLSVNPDITPDQLAAIDPGPPYVSNGSALRLAALAVPQNDADKIGGFSFTEFYGAVAARVGRALADARINADFKSQMAAQARNLRHEISGVSLDQEAILIIEFQRAYQSAARMVKILNELTEIAVNLYR